MTFSNHAPLSMRLALTLLALIAAPTLLAQSNLLELQREYRSLYQSTHKSVIMVSVNEIDADQAFGGGMQLRAQAGAEVGFVVADGYVITNAEEIMQSIPGARNDPKGMLEAVKTLWGRTASGTSFEMEVVGHDLANALTVCKLPATIKLPGLRVGESTQTKPGETVAALGNGFDVMLVDQQVGFYMGTLSEMTRFEPYDYYDTDAVGDPLKCSTLCFEGAVNPGDHGGPMINMRGEVIGMLTGHFHAGRRIGSAVPSSQFMISFREMVAGNPAPKPRFGFRVADADEVNERDPVITWVEESGPADAAGLKVGDELIMIDGYRVDSIAQFARFMGFGYTINDDDELESYGMPPGTVVLFMVKRDDELLSLELTAGKRENK